jgi:hypothetical protein
VTGKPRADRGIRLRKFYFLKDKVELLNKSSKVRKIQGWNTLNNIVNERSKSANRKQRVHGVRLTLMNNFDVIKDEDKEAQCAI